MTHEVSWPAANVRRLQRHALLPPAPSGTDPVEVAATLCGAHAQVLSAAELSIALRIEGATRTTVRNAMWDDHGLIKTYGPRGTVHLLAADDLPMWMAALSAIPAHSPFPDGVRLTPKQAEQIVDAIGHALEDSELASDELDRAVVNLAGEWAGDRVMPAFQELWPRWRQAVVMAAYRGVLCFGPVQLIAGMVAGVWHQRRSGRQIEVTVEPITRLIAGQRRALENQVDRIGEIFEGKARLTVGPVTAGAHA